MGKVVFLALLLAFGGWWIFHGGRVMSEDAINRQYDNESLALAKLDADYLCDQLAGDFRDEGISFTLAGTQRHDRDKQQSCDHLRDAFADIKRFTALSGGAFGLSFSNRVIAIELSEDRKTAEVEGIATIHMAGRLVSKTHYFDRVIRRYGRIRHAASESKSWVYVPAGN